MKQNKTIYGQLPPKQMVALLFAWYFLIDVVHERYPANAQRRKNVVTTSLQRHDVAATLLRRCVFAGVMFVCVKQSNYRTVELQWLEQLWDQEDLI